MWARLVISLLVSGLLMSGCGGGDRQSADEPRSAAPPAALAPPAVSGGGSGAAEPPKRKVRQAAVRRFRRAVKERCASAGKAARISASTADKDARRTQMTKEISYLKALDEALGKVTSGPPERGTGELRRQLKQYRRRLRAQIALDRRIARAEDSYSVGVGMSQNEKNRDARNTIVDEAGFDTCLRARAPR